MEDVGRRSARHFWHCRYEIEVALRYEGRRAGGELEGEDEGEAVEMED